jgi:hypothetical protein
VLQYKVFRCHSSLHCYYPFHIVAPILLFVTGSCITSFHSLL